MSSRPIPAALADAVEQLEAVERIESSRAYRAAFDAVLYAEGTPSPLAVSTLARFNGEADELRRAAADAAGVSMDTLTALLWEAGW